MGYIRNAVLIDAPVEKVFGITNDVRAWPLLFTEYASSEVIEQAEGSVTFRLTTKPDEHERGWSWIATRRTNVAERSTYSERDPSTGPFESMRIRWWYDAVGDLRTVMTWEQEFSLKSSAPMSDSEAVEHLNRQTRLQQQAVRENVERMCGGRQDTLYRGVIVARHNPDDEQKIVEAFTRSDATPLPVCIGVKARYVWVHGDIYLHFVEGQQDLPSILQAYAQDPLFQEVKAELDRYVFPLDASLPPMGKEIYRWLNPNVS